VGIGDDGHSQMGLEDIALMRVLPTMSVYQPMDDEETKLIMNYLVEKHQGPAYLRLTRQNLPFILSTASQETGAKWELHKIFKVKNAIGPRKTAIFATGASTAEALKAHALLSSKGLGVDVYNVHSLKPFDTKGTLQATMGLSHVYTVEDHSVIGGLGSCVSDALSSQGSQTKLTKLGVQDLFGESGECDELYDLHGISGNKIAERISKDLL
jgi:transketolase